MSATTRRKRSQVDGLLRLPCSCGRLIATDDDWRLDSPINEGERDDLCWGIGANHEFEWPDPAASVSPGGSR